MSPLLRRRAALAFRLEEFPDVVRIKQVIAEAFPLEQTLEESVQSLGVDYVVGGSTRSLIALVTDVPSTMEIAIEKLDYQLAISELQSLGLTMTALIRREQRAVTELITAGAGAKGLTPNRVSQPGMEPNFFLSPERIRRGIQRIHQALGAIMIAHLKYRAVVIGVAHGKCDVGDAVAALEEIAKTYTELTSLAEVLEMSARVIESYRGERMEQAKCKV